MEKATKNELDHVTGIGLDTLETTQTGTKMEPGWNPDGTQMEPRLPQFRALFAPAGYIPPLSIVSV